MVAEGVEATSLPHYFQENRKGPVFFKTFLEAFKDKENGQLSRQQQQEKVPIPF